MSKLKTIEEQRSYTNSEDYQARVEKLLKNSEYAGQPDDDKLNPWISHKETYRGDINRFDAMGLQLTSLMFNDVFNKDNPPNLQTKIFMQKFVEHSIGNNKLNSFLKQDVIKNQISYFDYITKSTAIDKINYFSYKTRNLKEMEQVLEKLEKVNITINDGNLVDKKDKLSLKEFAIASDLAKTMPLLEKLNDSCFIEGNKKLENIYKKASIAQKIINNIEIENKKDLRKAGPGIIALDNTNKKSDVLGRVLSFTDKLANFFSKHGHASMIHFDETGNVQRSHINPQFLQDNFDISKQLYASTYKINPIALIPQEKHQLLSNVYGEDWKMKIATKFQLIENEIHTEAYSKLSNISASGEKDQRLAGLSNLIPFGHKKLKANDFEELHNKVMSGEYSEQKDPKMLCSEFCATTIAAGLVELNQQVRQDLKQNKALNVLGVNLEKDNIVTIPFGKHEDLHKVHPDRLVKILEGYKCIEPVNIKINEYVKEHTKSTATKIGSQISEFVNTKIHRVSVHKSKQQPNSHKR